MAEQEITRADLPFMHFGEPPVRVDGPVYVPAEGAAPARSRFEISYYPHLMRKAVSLIGQPWVHNSDAQFYLMTNQDVDRTDGYIRPHKVSEVETFPDGDDQPPLNVITLDIPVSITECSLVVSENASNNRMITMSPLVIPLDVPAVMPNEGGSDDC